MMSNTNSQTTRGNTGFGGGGSSSGFGGGEGNLAGLHCGVGGGGHDGAVHGHINC